MATSSADILKSTQPGVISGHLLNGVRVSSAASQHAWQTMADTRGDVVRIDIPADPQARVAFVRRWMAKNQKALKNTGMAATLVLPLLAQQALADSKVAINDLQGVAEVIRMPNGSLTLLMNNGYRIDLAAADVALEGGRVVVDITALMEALGNDSGLLVPLSQLPDVQSWELLPNGDVLITRADGSQMTLARSAVVQQGDLLLISPSSALQYGVAEGTDFGNLLFVPSASFSPAVSGTSMASSSTPVSSFADIPPWLYVGGGAIALGAAAAGGGGGGGGGGGETGPSTISGYVIDGYISGATVTREFDANSVTTNGSGFFSDLQGSGILTATGGVDISTGLPFTGVLRAPDGSTVITPLTTMMVQLSQQFELSNADAQADIKTVLGLDQRVDLMTTDPLSTSSPNVELLIAGAKVANLLAMVATAGISSADALSRLGVAFSQAAEEGRALTNQEMADALGLPSIAGQVKQELDDIDAAGVNLDLDAYRDGSRNPLRDAQREAQDPNSDLSSTIVIRSALDYLTLEQAVSLAQNGELPDQYLVNPNEPLPAGNLGLTAAADRLTFVQRILAGDYDVDTAPIALSDIYTWSILASARDVLVSGGLERPEIVGAERVTITNNTIRPDQYRALDKLDNFELGNVVVSYTLEQALGELADDLIMPANYTIDPDTPYPVRNLTLREAAELLENTRQLLERSKNAESDNLTREDLFNWHIVDSVTNILAMSAANPELGEALSVRVTVPQITPEQFVSLDRLDNFILEPTEVRYTLAQALEAEPLASNYIINLDKVLNAGTVTVAQAEGAFADVSRILEGANNQPPLTLFVWEISDTAEAIIADLDQPHVIEANQVAVSNRVISSAQFEQLDTLENFELGNTIVRYTLENAVSADSIAANYEIDTETPFNAGNVSVEAARTTLAAVESILAGALNPQTPNADALFNWTVLDTVDAILEAGNVAHLLRANAVNVSDALITLSQYQALVNLDSNYVRSGETVEYTLSEAISAEDAGTLLTNYAINLDAILNANEVTVAEAREAYTQIDGLVGNAENRDELRENLPFSWVVVDEADRVIADVEEDHVTLADQVRVTEMLIVQDQYETLEGLANFDLGATVVEYTLEGADTTQIALADNYLLTSDIYNAGDLTVNVSRTTLERVDNIVDGATNAAQLDADTLFNWTVVDSVINVISAINEEHLARADLVNVNNQRITIEQFQQLEGLATYSRSSEWVEYTLEQAFTESKGALVDSYAINEGTRFVPEPLAVADAIDDLATIRSLIAIAENTVVFENVYQWSVLDSYSNIQAQLGADLPDGLRLALEVQVTNPTLEAEEYETLISGLNNFEFGVTTNVTYDDIDDALRARGEGQLAPNGRFSLLDETAPFAPGELSVADASAELANVRAVLTGANGLENDDATVQAFFDWTVTDSANNIIQAINQDHVTLANKVLITNDEITFDQYNSLIELINYAYAEKPVVVRYTMEEALEEGVEKLDKDGSDDSVGYRIGSEVFAAGTFTAAGALALVEDANAAISGANTPLQNLTEILEWQVVDSSKDILATREDGTFPQYISGATQVSLIDNIITLADFRSLDVVSINFVLGDTPVRFVLTESRTLTQIQSIADNYEIVANDENLPIFNLDTVAEAEERYSKTQEIIDGALNRDNITVEELQTWSITSADPTALFNARDEAWVIGANNITLDLSDDEVLTPEQYEAFVTLNYVDLDTVSVEYTLEQAIELITEGVALPAGSDERPGGYQIQPAELYEAGTFTVANVNQLLTDVTTVFDGAQNNAELDHSVLLSWIVEDSADNLIAALEQDAIQDASRVRVNTDEIGYLDFEALSVLDNFDQTGLTVSYPLGELVRRFLSGGDIPDTYALDTGEDAFFEAGALDVHAAERLFDTATTLINGAANNDVELSSLSSWFVQDTYLNLYEQSFVENGDIVPGFLQMASAIVVIDSTLSTGQIDDLDFAFAPNYTHQSGAEPGGSVAQLSKAFTVDGQPDGDVDLITDFRVGNAAGFDELFVGLTADEVKSLRGYPDDNDASAWENFKIYKESTDNFSSLDSDGDIAFAVFTTASFEGDWLNDLTWLDNGEIVFLLAGAGDESDDAWLKRVEGVEGVEGSEAYYERLATFENLDLNNFLEENWNTNYTFT